eukprot:CAMPEP_0174587010 /NCGR_PEP_ID=MMETSP0929-20130131/29392_1 /TAXON_ID=548131 ORGANISM="Ostreococcus mediterraneus, Strain clade-D-RCC2572" /NCGR_SAMPLE_ID=MMETSP0929 /ASSEMBLY_ACC=CAM_ASM_000573 /LENGTH=292 /DNA_ID=CAMNT_0015769045 /DNA_START=19 /DNA_END=897 /DNA_ORIENTATION=-
MTMHTHTMRATCHASPSSSSRVVFARHQSRRIGTSASKSASASVKTRATAGTDDEFRASVEGMSADPCDDFVCKSSPAVERTLKTVLKDINALRGTTRSTSSYAPDVVYDDGVLKFRGADKYKKYCSYIENNLKQATSRVTSISMVDGGLDAARVTWELNGVNDIGRVGVDIECTYKMNLITGRILEHREMWVVNPSRTDAQAGALLESTRKAHALPLNIMETYDGVKKSMDDVLRKFSVDNDDDASKDMYTDPNDPMKFFQNEDTSKTDILQLATAAAVLFLITKVFQVLN